MLENAFGGGTDRIERILSLTERLERIDRATSQIRYNNDLLTEVPEVLKALGAAKEQAIAALKTV